LAGGYAAFVSLSGETGLGSLKIIQGRATLPCTVCLAHV
jgi:hypothetical protein